MHRLRTSLTFVGFSCFALFLSMLLTTTHAGYAVNIYSVVPIWGWLSFTATLVCGTLLIYLGARADSRRAAIHGTALVFITFGVFWFFPRFLGFRFWSASRGDLLHHYGLAKSIIETGGILGGDVYPPLHILLAQLHMVTGIQYGTLGPILSLIYYPLLIGGVIAVVRRLATPKIALYVGIAGIPLAYQRFSQHLVPWVAFLALVPWLFVLLDAHRSSHSRRQRGWIVFGIVVIGTGIALGHPMSALVGGAAITILGGCLVLGMSSSEKPSVRRVLSLRLLLPLVLIYPMWYLSRTTFQRFLGTIISSIFGDIQGAGASVVSRASTSSYTLQQLIVEYLIEKWGTALLVIGTGGIIAAVIAYRSLRRRASINEMSLLTLYVAGLVLALILLAGNFVTNGYAVYRINQLTIVAAFVLIGCALWWASKRTGWRRALRYPLLLVILVGVIATPFTVYSETQHIEEQEYTGADYYLEYADWDTTLYQYRMSVPLAEYLLGTLNTPSYQNRVFGPGNAPPDRLGYDENTTLRRTLGAGEYNLITKSRDMEWYTTEPQNRLPYLDYYTRSDENRLRADSAVSRVYSNGGFSIWHS